MDGIVFALTDVFPKFERMHRLNSARISFFIILMSAISIFVMAQDPFNLPDAVIVGKGIKVYSGPDFSSDVLFHTGTGTGIKILSVNKEKQRDSKSRDTCNFFPWVEAEFRNGKKGFVFGRNVFVLGTEPVLSIGRAADYDCPPFMLYRARNFSIGASVKDEDGFQYLTGCDDFSLMVFWFPQKQELALMELTEPVTERYPNVLYWIIVHEPSRVDHIQYLARTEGSNIKAIVLIDYLEGCGGYELAANVCGTNPTGRVLNRYRKDKESDCRD